MKKLLVNVGEISPCVNLTNIIHELFLYKSLFGSFFYLHVTREKLPKKCSYKKFLRKMLMKLTLGEPLDKVADIIFKLKLITSENDLTFLLYRPK